jgi:hypothetical protein
VLQTAHAFEQARPWADHWPTMLAPLASGSLRGRARASNG